MKLSWEAPVDDGGALDGYQYRHSAGSTVTTTATWSATVTAKEATVTGLTNGMGYAFEVRAVNSAGERCWGRTRSVYAPAPRPRPPLRDETDGDRTPTPTPTNLKSRHLKARTQTRARSK